MVNPISFGPSGINSQADFSPLANLGNIYQKAQQDAANKQAIAAFQQTGDTRALLGSGDMSLAKLGAELEQQKRAQTNADRSFDFQKQSHADTLAQQNKAYTLQERTATRADEAQKRADAIAARGEYVIKEVEAADGTKSLVRVKVLGPEGAVGTGAGGAPAPASVGNPFNQSGGKFTEGEGKAAGFADRMLQSEAILSGAGVASNAEGPASPGVQDQGANKTQAALNATPKIGNFLISSERKAYEQAKRTFINSQLRRESGATIQDAEFLNAEKQYFPQPGDPPEQVAQKAETRRAAIEAMGREGGRSYRPKQMYDTHGKISPYGASPAPPTSTASSTAAAPVVDPATASGRPASGSLPRPTTEAGMNALKSGQRFIAPDGTERVKP